MKDKIKVYIYQNGEYMGMANSEKDAANIAGCTTNTVSRIIRGEQTATRSGYVFKDHKLNEEEISNLPIRETNTKTIDNNTFEINQNSNIFHISRNKEQRKEEFKEFIFTKMKDRWMNIPKNAAILERQYIREFLQAI